LLFGILFFTGTGIGVYWFIKANVEATIQNNMELAVNKAKSNVGAGKKSKNRKSFEDEEYSSFSVSEIPEELILPSEIPNQSYATNEVEPNNYSADASVDEAIPQEILTDNTIALVPNAEAKGKTTPTKLGEKARPIKTKFSDPSTIAGLNISEGIKKHVVKRKAKLEDLFVIGKLLLPSILVWNEPKDNRIRSMTFRSPNTLTAAKLQWWLAPYAERANDFNYEVPTTLVSLKKAETPNSVQKIGLNVEAKKGNFKLFSGLGFTRFNTTTNYKTEGKTYTYDTSYYMVKRNYTNSPSNNGIALIKRQIDTSSQSYTVKHCANCAQRFDYLSIPLGLGYSIPFIGSSIDIDAQLVGNVFLGQKGEYANLIDGNGSVESVFIESINQPLFWESRFGLGLSQTFNDRFRIGANFGYNYGLSSMMKNYEQKPSYWSTRVNVGILLGN